MATQTAIGNITGSRLQPSLTVTVWDDAGGTLSYSTALDAAISIAPAQILNANLNSSDINIQDRSKSAITFEMNYGRKQSVTLTRNITGATRPRKLYDWISPQGVVDSTGDVTSSYTYVQNRLHQMGSMFEYDSNRPVIRDPLNETLTLSYTALSGLITDSYIKTVLEMVDGGRFNNDVFWGYFAGELQIVSFTASEQTDGSWQLGYGFGIRYNESSVGVADGIVIPYLRGCDDWWPIREEVFSDGAVQPKTKAAVYGQLWELDDFDELELPWQGYLSTRTDGAAGIVTTTYPHGMTASDSVYIYWEGGYRLSTDISAVTATTFTFSLGSGDTLPAAGTRVLASTG